MFTLVSEETYADGQIIFNENSSGDWVYVVISGSVEIFKEINEKKCVIEVLREGEVFGEMSFIGIIKRTASVRAIGETTVGVIDRDTLDQEFNKLSSDFRSILVAIIRRFKKMADRVSDFSVRSEPRVLKTLSLSYKDKQSFLKVYTGNISNGGLFIKTKTPLDEGEQFILKLQLPELSEPITIKCKVAWAKKQEDGPDKLPPGMGVQFMEMNEKGKKTLNEYVRSLMKG
jgi:CRP/FNR family cyclic AMP-dependent transcriptional regulator